MMLETISLLASRIKKKKTRENVLAETLDNLEVKGAAQEASPNLIWGTSWSSSNSESLDVIVVISNFSNGLVFLAPSCALATSC